MANAIDTMRVLPGAVAQVELGEAVSSKGQMIVVKTADAEAYAATDATGQRVVGINLQTGSEGDTISVQKGVWILTNSSNNAITDAYIGNVCYVEDSKTVSTSSGTYSVIAGTVVDVQSIGVLVDVGKDNSTAVSST